MSTFTVYCHGTGFNRIKGVAEDELVAWFHSHTDGVEAQLGGGAVRVGNYMINDGPGHSGNGLQQPQQVNPISGDRKVGLSLKKTLFKGPSFADHAAGKTGGPRTFEKSALAHGVLSGEGWDENVIRTVNLIQDLKFDKGQAIDVVNLVGWSRGAVTCMRIANKMYEVFGSEVKCNIIAVDPVAGNDAGLSMADTQVLEANVERYVGILAMHEMRTTFKPQDWSRIRAPATTAIFLPMPGVHNAQVMVKTPPDAAMITRNLACGLLRDWGSPIGSTPFGHLSSAPDMCIAYARLVLALSEHKSYESQTVKGRLGGSASLRRRDFAKHSKMDTYTRGGKESYWINEHHRACFAAAFPDIYEFIFESSGSGEIALTAQSRFSTFFRALRQAPALRQSLMAKGLLDEASDTQYTIAVGAGRYTNQVRCAWPDGFPLHA